MINHLIPSKSVVRLHTEATQMIGQGAEQATSAANLFCGRLVLYAYMPPPSSMPRLTPAISMFFFFSRRCKCRDIYCTHNCPRSNSNRRRPLFSIKHREREKVNHVWHLVCYQYSLAQWNWFSVVTGCTWHVSISDVREPISLHQAAHCRLTHVHKILRKEESIYARQNASMAKLVSLINYKCNHNRPFFLLSHKNETRDKLDWHILDVNQTDLECHPLPLAPSWVCTGGREENTYQQYSDTTHMPTSFYTLTRHTCRPLFCTFVLCPS